MKEKILKCAFIVVSIIIAVLAIYNTYEGKVTGEQYIKTSIPSKINQFQQK